MRMKVDTRMWNYVVTHWQGKLGLVKSFFQNGLTALILFFAVAVALIIGGLPDSQPVNDIWLVLMLVWATWACVGAFRYRLYYALERVHGKVRRVGGVLVMVIVVVFAWFTAQDLYHLFIYPLLLT